MPPYLWRCAGLRGHGGRLGRCLLAETLGLVPTGCTRRKRRLREIEVRAAKHLAFHHFQPVDVPLDRAGTPRQGDIGFNRCIVLAEPARKALEGLQRTGRRAREPGIEALGLPLADQGREVLCEVDRLGHLGRLCVSWMSCCASASVRPASRLRTSHVTRRGVKGWATGSATTGRRWRRPWQQGGMPGPGGCG